MKKLLMVNEYSPAAYSHNYHYMNSAGDKLHGFHTTKLMLQIVDIQSGGENATFCGHYHCKITCSMCMMCVPAGKASEGV